MVLTSIRFSDKEKLKFYQHHAKAKYHLDFSKYIKMLIHEDLKALRKPPKIKEEWELIKQLKGKNNLLKKEIFLLKHHVETLFDLNTAKIIKKIKEVYHSDRGAGVCKYVGEYGAWSTWVLHSIIRKAVCRFVANLILLIETITSVSGKLLPIT
ncbi:MAG: hypothetical protein ACTSVE_03990 [Candidatus Helarchaeota archaeon]